MMANIEKRWVIFPLIISSLLCVLLYGTFFNMDLNFSLDKINSMFLIPLSQVPSQPKFAELKTLPLSGSTIPCFAYLVSGSKGDLEKLWRTLHAIYHPRNQYVVHLDLASPAIERLELASRIRNHGVFSKVGNVHMMTKANMITYTGPTMVANTLQACAILLRRSNHWDWFINLSASDYPLVTQDDLLYVFSSLNRSLNFIEHTSRLGWKAAERAKPIIIDHGLYKSTKQNISRVERINRTLPNAFKLFTGSAWMVLSRSFVEYFILGWDNLPRTLLMYYTNFVSSPEFYFHTLICNTPEFAQTVVNHDLHYISWDKRPKQHPQTLSLKHTKRMISSNAPFSRKFKQDAVILDKIDINLLGRINGSFTPGGWCSGYPMCSQVGDMKSIKPGLGAKRLYRLMSNLVMIANHHLRQCK